jgi:hypothetical protein
MAWYPLADKQVIAPGPNDPPIQPVGAILHVDAGNASSLFSLFNGPSNGIESHFFIPKVGPIQQYRDTAYEADANLKANSFIHNGVRCGFVSIETQGLEAGEWTTYQLAQIKTLLKWLSETHNFPLSVCKGPFDPGVGYHTMFGAPGPWTPVAKTCPGPDRIRQFNAVLVPWFSQGHAPAPVTPPTLTEAEVNEILKAIAALDVKVSRLDQRESDRYAAYNGWKDAILNEVKKVAAAPGVVK